MNEYNIKVGDYVETNLGGIGYVTVVLENAFQWEIIKKNNSPNAADIGCWVYCEFSDIKKHYKRIGANDFGKNKDEFELIENFNDLSVVESIYIKFNELIDHINAIQEKLNEYGYEKERH